MLGTMIVAWFVVDLAPLTVPFSYQAIGDGSADYGCLQLWGYGDTFAEYSYAGTAMVLRVVDQGYGIRAVFHRQLPPQLTGGPLIVLQEGPDCTSTEATIGPWSLRSGNRVEPPQDDDGTNGYLRLERIVDPGGDPGTDLVWNVLVGPCHEADLDGSGSVDGGDISVLLGEWWREGPWLVSDLNHDNVVDGEDIGILLGKWGEGFGLPT